MIQILRDYSWAPSAIVGCILLIKALCNRWNRIAAIHHQQDLDEKEAQQHWIDETIYDDLAEYRINRITKIPVYDPIDRPPPTDTSNAIHIR